MSSKRTRSRSAKRVVPDSRNPEVLDAGPHRITFSFRFADRSHHGAWAWPKDDEPEEVLNFLCDIGASTWAELRAHLAHGSGGSHRKHHAQHIDTLCPDARQRLTALSHNRMFGNEIFRFRVGGRKRLWGFIDDGVFYVVWWDPEHGVYPVGKD